jgi:hypothetical protein
VNVATEWVLYSVINMKMDSMAERLGLATELSLEVQSVSSEMNSTHCLGPKIVLVLFM